VQPALSSLEDRSVLAKAASHLTAAAKGLALVHGPADRLTSLEQQIGALSADDDLASFKSRLISEVAMARAEVLQERQKISDLISGTLHQLGTPPEQSANDMTPVVGSIYLPDQLTGLPTRAYTEAKLTLAHGLAGDCYLAVFVVKRLALINAKFGFARGDQVLLKVVTHLAQALPDFHSFFRWTPCSFIAMAPTGTTFPQLRSKIQVIELTRITPTLEWEGHSAMVPVALDCRVISLRDFTTVTELFSRLDKLASDV